MQCFFVHITCRLGRTYEVAAKLADREIASEIHSISGEYDLLAKFYLAPGEDVGRFIAENLHDVDGVERTVTTITFKAF
ncbi:Lrp/AsnC ligand binding domain-containing protein [Rubrimonas cliftonensis]|uniref:Transcriptional regulator, AsnC family n=1 Tax=Rubrimonas cliftonensis TaxID=89524 RepID=A0A1H4D8L2_9RHOB|nr:Lrp/AsnC ligand binding domain-containing protein [Rubrimonas cliftonensis]SEA69031.1 transcriptional regulator, AsnC family [Rubrimonas cliftonensis]